ncbi:ABC transporter substrate-binding protein [Streptomyces sp. NPDC006879]|uniref:ABC transporter substrate-binding protein n=1 Tax=Streptomyces sp. NPDC006879 TaxID=3364767 RepID=UPI00368E4B06
MFNRTRCLQTAAALASISLLSGCGLLSSDGNKGSGQISVGTTSKPTRLDPATTWDGSWELYRNVFQTLLSFPTGSTRPRPDAAQSCEFTDSANESYRCTLRKGLKFSNGEPLNAQAVKHSLDRVLNIAYTGGPKDLLGSLDRIEVTDELTVVFHLKTPDATFPFVLATPATSLVAPKAYGANAPRDEKDTTLVGSGPYLLKEYKPKERAELVRNPDYKGFAERRNDGVTIRYFESSDLMVSALKANEIDVTYRGLTAAEIKNLQSSESRKAGIQVVDAVGAEIRYLVFNPKDPAAANPAVRKAIAHVIDRSALVAKVYQGTAEALYSMVPRGISGHTTAFYDTYGDPNVPAAKELLRDAGITDKVKLTLWYTSDRYGSSTSAEFLEIKRQLEESGLFEIKLQHREWEDFQKGYHNGEYPVFGRGWFPDFPDPDNYIAPFVGKENAVGTPYESKTITTDLLPKSRREKDRSAVNKEFRQAQQILADDVRLLPLWQGKFYTAAGEDIGGAERALDPQSVMQMWELYRKASW